MINRIVTEYFCTNWKKKYRNRSSSLRRAISVSKIWQRFEDSLQISASMANVTHVYIPIGNNIQFAIRIRIAELCHDTYTCATYLWIRFVNSIRKSVDVFCRIDFHCFHKYTWFLRESWKSSIISEILSFHAFRN